MFPEKKPQFYRFNGFAVDSVRRLLLRDDRPVPLKPKAFDLLLALVENHGQIITKEQLLERVWPDQFVEEGNLTVHISAVRKALGERKNEHRYVVTIPGQGYQFVGVVARDEAAQGVIIEEHTLSRITVDELEGSDNQTLSAAGIDQATKTLVAPNGAANSAAANVQLNSVSAGPSIIQRRGAITAAIVVTVALGLVIGSFFALRLYRDRNQQRAFVSRFTASETNSRQLTVNGNVGTAALSRDGKYFVYLVLQGGKESLWLGNVDGRNTVQVRAPEEVFYGDLAFAPDGSSIFYELNGSLFRIPVLGGLPEKVLDRMATNFSISTDGKQVAFFRGDFNKGQSMVVASLDSSVEREVLTVPSGRSLSLSGPAWSPDDAMLAFGAAAENNPSQLVLMSVRIADGKLQQLNPHTWDSIHRVAWLHDGSGILFHARGPMSDFQIWLLDYPQGGLRRITDDLSRYGRQSLSVSDDGRSLLLVRGVATASIWAGPAANLKQLHQITKSSLGKAEGSEGLSWTPDGKIVYPLFLNGSSSLWMMDADGSGAQQITSSGFLDYFPNVTCEGRCVVFESNRGGGSDIWRVNLDSSDLRQLTTGGKSSHPSVSPDGKWILYAVSESGTHAIWKVSIDGGEPSRLTGIAVNWPKVSPDNKLFACAYSNKSVSPQTYLGVLLVADGQLLYRFDLASSATFDHGLRWSPDGSAVIYRDFVGGLWRQSLKGGSAEKLPDIQKRVYSFEWSPDGKQFALSYDDEPRDVVLLSSFR